MQYTNTHKPLTGGPSPAVLEHQTSYVQHCSVSPLLGTMQLQSGDSYEQVEE